MSIFRPWAAEPPVKTLPLATIQTGAISSSAEEDRYTFHAETGELIIFDSLLAGPNLLATLIAPTGKTLASWQDGADGEPLLLLVPGTHTLVLSAAPGTAATGEYAFRILKPQERLIEPGITAGSLPNGNEVAAYSLAAARGDRFSLAASGLNSSSLAVYSPSGAPLVLDYAPHDGAEFLAPMTGRYTIVVWSREFTRTDFSLHLTQVSAATPQNEGFGLRRSGQVARGTVQTFEYTARAATIAMLVCRTGSRAIVTLKSPGGQTLFRNDSFLVSNPLLLPENGVYIVEVAAPDGADSPYDFVLLDLAAAADPIKLGHANAPNGLGHSVHSFEARAGDQIFYDALSEHNDFESLHIVAPSGATLPATQTYRDALLALNETGTHYIVRAAPGRPLATSFRILSKTLSPSSELRFDAPLEIPTQPINAVHLCRLDLQAGRRFFIRSRPSSLYNPHGEFENYTWDGFYIPQLSGTYTVVLNAPTVAPIQIAAEHGETVTEPLTLGATTLTAIDRPHQQRRFSFQGAAEERLFYIPLRSNYGLAEVVVYDPDGAWVFGGDAQYDSGLFTLKRSGQYTVSFNGKEGATGPIEFLIVDVAQPPVQVAEVNSRIVAGGPWPFRNIFRLQGVQGQRLLFNSSPPASVALYRPDNIYLFPNSSDSSSILPVTGEYILVVSSNGNDPFDLTIRTPGSIETQISTDELVSGAIERLGDGHTYILPLEAEDVVFFDRLTVSPDAPNLSIRILNRFGGEIGYSFGAEDAGPFSSLDNAPLKILVQGVGQYRFRVRSLRAAPLLSPETRSQLDPSGEASIFRVPIEAPTEAHFSLTMDPNVSGSWQLARPDRQVRHQLFAYPLGAMLWPDEHYLILSAYPPPSQPSPFTINFAATQPVVEPAGFGVIHSGVAVANTVGPTFTIPGIRTQLTYFDALGGDEWVMLDGFNHAGRAVSTISAGHDAMVQLLETGENAFRARVQSDSRPRQYAFRFIDLNDAPVMAMETPVLIPPDVPYGAIVRAINLVGGQRYYIDKLGPRDDPAAVRVFGPHGESPSISTHNYEDAEFYARKSGKYWIAAPSGTTADAPFHLAIRSYSAAPEILPGQMFTTTIGPAEARLFRFRGVEGKRMAFRGLSRWVAVTGNLYTDRWYDHGYLDPTSSRDLGVLSAGEHYFYLRNLRMDDASISFRIDAVSDIERQAQVGELVEGRIESAFDWHLISFNLRAGQQLYYDSLLSGDSATYATLLDASGNVIVDLGFHDRDRGPFEIAHSGRYTLRLPSNTAPVNYRFRLLDLSAAAPLLPDRIVFAPLAGLATRIYRALTEPGQRLRAIPLEQSSAGEWKFVNSRGQMLAIDAAQRVLQTTKENASLFLILSSTLSENSTAHFRLEVGNHPPTIDAPHTIIIPGGQQFTFAPRINDREGDNDLLTPSYTITTPSGTTSHLGATVTLHPAEVTAPELWTIHYTAQDDGIPSLQTTTSMTVTVVPRPQILDFAITEGRAEIMISTTPGFSYALETTPDLLADARWQRVTTQTATAATLALIHPFDPDSTAGFYRVVIFSP